MSIHHGKNAKASRRERRKALRDARWLHEARQGRWPHSKPAIQNLPRIERVFTLPRGDSSRCAIEEPSWTQRLLYALTRMFRTDQ